MNHKISSVSIYLNHLNKRPAVSDLKDLLQLAIPVIGSTFMSVAYNLINMLFVGHLGSGAIAAVGTAGFFLNLGWALSSLPATGAGIKVSHAIGKGNDNLSRTYVRSGMTAILALSFIYMSLLLIFRSYLIGFFDLNDSNIEETAISYLALTSLSVPFTFLNYFYSSVFNGYGETRTPFRINLAGISLNILLDFILIIPAGMGVMGAAVATIVSQIVIIILYQRQLKKFPALKPGKTTFRKLLLWQILKLGVSPSIQRIVFVIIAIFMARIISEWGAVAIAVQKVGVQIEALTFMTVSGFGSALSTLSGQAYGARRYRKQWDYYCAGLWAALMIGISTTLLFVFAPGPLVSLFFHDPESIAMSKEYLIILGYSQLFMCIEILTAGAFFGFGRTHIPALTSISLTVIRIPLALFLIYQWHWGLSGVWWSISMSSMAKGTLLCILFIVIIHRFLKRNTSKP
ncbi:MAG: MATE family efflux transporter [Bacteroidales bacterium]|nr:MATE family efflux transporter [Bacteroidales bacterium]